MPRLAVILIAVLGGVVVVGVIAAVIFVSLAARPAADGDAGATPSEPPAPAWAPPAEAPVVAATPGPGIAGLVDPAWVASTAERTDIPDAALAAYAGVALWKAGQMPSCGLSWNLLAGIGLAESDHGRHDGSSIGPDGTVTPPIYGVSLAGGDTAHIPDSDGGAIDGDAEYDRAVGPMQLIPQTWRNWHVDGNGDGVEDPQNISDAVMATANYLCRSASALDTEVGWQAAVASYNSAESYRDVVARAADSYR